jgi:hypothetical protein
MTVEYFAKEKYEILCKREIRDPVQKRNTRSCAREKYEILCKREIRDPVQERNTRSCAKEKYEILCTSSSISTV